jgi:hypothetical protein
MFRVVVHGLLDEKAAQALATTIRDSKTPMIDTIGVEVKPDTDGELGLDVALVGTVAQALGTAAADRGKVTREQVVDFLLGGDYDEAELWETVGPLIDAIEHGARSVPVTS